MKENPLNRYGFSERNEGTVEFKYRQKYGVGRETETKTIHGLYSKEEMERDWKAYIAKSIENEHDLSDKHVTDEHEITKAHVTDEHNKTKEHITEEHDQTQAHVSSEASQTRSFVQARKNELASDIASVQSTVNSISTRVGQILGWVSN